jgi:hypothetical protein
VLKFEEIPAAALCLPDIHSIRFNSYFLALVSQFLRASWSLEVEHPVEGADNGRLASAFDACPIALDPLRSLAGLAQDYLLLVEGQSLGKSTVEDVLEGVEALDDLDEDPASSAAIDGGSQEGVSDEVEVAEVVFQLLLEGLQGGCWQLGLGAENSEVGLLLHLRQNID